MRLSILLSLIVFTSCTNHLPVLIQDTEIFNSEERATIESALTKFNTEYEIFINVVVSDYPQDFSHKKSQTENLLRLYLSPTKDRGSLALSHKLQEVCPPRLVSKLEKQVLEKYLKQNQPVRGILSTSNSLVQHLVKKRQLERREPSQDTAYLVFGGLILIFLLLIWYNHRSKNKVKVHDPWTNAYIHGD